MAWGAARRATYRREEAANLTDTEWAVITRSGNQFALSAARWQAWRYMPRDGVPPRSTVYNVSASYRRAGPGPRSGPNCT